jgi:hypothetical protein
MKKNTNKLLIAFLMAILAINVIQWNYQENKINEIITIEEYLN